MREHYSKRVLSSTWLLLGNNEEISSANFTVDSFKSCLDFEKAESLLCGSNSFHGLVLLRFILCVSFQFSLTFHVKGL